MWMCENIMMAYETATALMLYNEMTMKTEMQSHQKFRFHCCFVDDMRRSRAHIHTHTLHDGIKFMQHEYTSDKG